MASNKRHQHRTAGLGQPNLLTGRAVSVARAFGDLLTFGAEPGPYEVPARGESVAKGWTSTGDALRRALSTAREKA